MKKWAREHVARMAAGEVGALKPLDITPTPRKPILCVDFDGVLHSYTSGWQGAAVCTDPPVSGAVNFLRRAREHFDVQIYSSRSHQPGGIDAMQRWLLEHSDSEWLVTAIGWPEHKPSAFITIDDRAMMFDGRWPDLDKLKAFKPWNKR